MRTHEFRTDSGFSLIELLVVILIVGLLATIAVPMFLRQQEKGQDTDAKSNAKNLTTYVRACYTNTQSYLPCSSADLDDTGLPIGSARGQVEAVTTNDSFEVTAYSQSGGEFIVKIDPGSSAMDRICNDGTAGHRTGGCPSDGNW